MAHQFKRVGQFHPTLRRLLLLNSLGVMDSMSNAQSRGKALREAEGYTFRLTDRIHTMFKNLGQRVFAQPCAKVPTVHAACAIPHTHAHSHPH